MCIGIIFMLLVNVVFAQETIKWVISIEPPITYQIGDDFAGYGIEIMEMIQSRMDDYQHQIVVAGNYKRLVSEVERGPLTCALGLFKTEDRLNRMYFSKVPVFYFFNMQIVLRKSLFDQLQQPESLSLRDMLSNTDKKMGLSKGRVYSKEITSILKDFEESDNIFSGSQSNVSESLINMLVAERIDYIILYPEEATYLSRKLGIEDQVVTVPIQEAEDFGYTWAVCTKNETGKLVMDTINDILVHIRKENEYRKQYEAWLSRNLIDHYRANYQENFLKIIEE